MFFSMIAEISLDQPDYLSICIISAAAIRVPASANVILNKQAGMDFLSSLIMINVWQG